MEYDNTTPYHLTPARSLNEDYYTIIVLAQVDLACPVSNPHAKSKIPGTCCRARRPALLLLHEPGSRVGTVIISTLIPCFPPIIDRTNRTSAIRDHYTEKRQPLIRSDSLHTSHNTGFSYECPPSTTHTRSCHKCFRYQRECNLCNFSRDIFHCICSPRQLFESARR